MTLKSHAGLLRAAGLIRDLALADLSKITIELEHITAEEHALKARVREHRAALSSSPELIGARPGAFELWIRHVRGQEARLAARREAIAAEHRATFDRAKTAFGRVEALKSLLQEEATKSIATR
jgi:hypothetical protein